MQFEESCEWIKTAAFAISHHMGIDGISLFLVILTTFLTPLAILCTTIEEDCTPTFPAIAAINGKKKASSVTWLISAS